MEKYNNGLLWITRLKTDKRYVINQASDEVLIYYARRFVSDYAKMPIYDNRTHGYILEPVVQPKINPMTGVVEKYEPVSEKPYFWIPFSPEAVDKIISEFHNNSRSISNRLRQSYRPNNHTEK